MKAIRIQLDDRRKEFRAYVRMLAHLEARLLHTARLKRVGDLPTNETFKSMKATAFLMLYNVIESTVVGVMTELYKVIEQEGCKLPDVSVKLQDLWIDQRFRMPRDATSATYRKRVAEMLRETMHGKKLVFDPKQLRLGGNIDGDALRDICNKHGCNLLVHQRARGGAELGTVKVQRNDLAHGTKTFVECGQSYGVSDIDRISRECFNFLGNFVSSVRRFVMATGYRR